MAIITGTIGHDRLVDNQNENDTISALQGDDEITARNGRDDVTGGAGFDILAVEWRNSINPLTISPAPTASATGFCSGMNGFTKSRNEAGPCRHSLH